MMALSRKTILVLTVSAWDEPKRLRKQIAEVLSVEWDVVYVTLPYGFLKPRKNTDFMASGLRVLSLAGPIFPMRLLSRMSWLRAAYQELLAFRLLRQLGDISRIGAVFCFTSTHPRVLACLKGIPIIFVANDDHASMADSELARKQVHSDEALVIGLSDRVVSVSEVIARKLGKHGKPVHVMYPGHDCSPLSVKEAIDQRRIPDSACFYGYIDWRIDFDLLRKLLDDGWHVVLIGPVVGVADKVAALADCFPDHFELQSALDTNLAPRVLSQYQVLMMPYRYRTPEQAEVMELPNKTFIYFSALRPIVTTWMPNLKLVESGLIYRAKSSKDFLTCCRQAIQEDGADYMSRRFDLAAENTWPARTATLRSLMDGTAPALALES